MCGILGIMPAVNVDIFRKALRTLAHRGPDDEGIEIVDNSIILGHRRLSILDLSSAGKLGMVWNIKFSYEFESHNVLSYNL